MVERMSLNDGYFRQIMVGDNTAEYGDREDQHKDRQIQDSDQAVSCQAPLNHGGNDEAVTRHVSASQKQLIHDVVELNMAAKKGKNISAYPEMSPDEIGHRQREAKQYGLRRSKQKN